MTHGTLTKSTAVVVLFTVNANETDAVHSAFGTPSGAKRIGRRRYWDLGILGGTHVVHAVTQMGDQATDAAVRAALESLSPTLVICVGIAWGAKPTKQHIGDILLATRVRDRAHRKEEEDKTIPRGFLLPPNDDRLQIARSSYSDWMPNFQVSKPTLHEGLLLSDPILYDNQALRDKALVDDPEAIGGEMEGRGLVWSLYQEKCDWLIVKAICDWGSKKNSPEVNKEASQRLAARNAAEFVHHLIENEVGARFGGTSIEAALAHVPALRENHQSAKRLIIVAICVVLGTLILGMLSTSMVVVGSNNTMIKAEKTTNSNVGTGVETGSKESR